jgi:hypothetical protein
MKHDLMLFNPGKSPFAARTLPPTEKSHPQSFACTYIPADNESLG